MEPERRPQGDPGTTPEERRRLTRAAALRPMNLLVLAIGGVSFAATLSWWVPLVTLATYAALVLLGSRDPLLQRRVLGDGGKGAASPAESGPGAVGTISPDRRARWLPRGETRQRVEEALEAQRRAVAAIEGSDEVTRAVLEDSVPKLHAVANRLVDVAESREKAAGAMRDMRRSPGTRAVDRSNAAEETRRALEEKVRAADREISETSERLQTLRARIVRVSLDAGNLDRATALDASLDELNARLQALNETITPR